MPATLDIFEVGRRGEERAVEGARNLVVQVGRLDYALQPVGGGEGVRGVAIGHVRIRDQGGSVRVTGGKRAGRGQELLAWLDGGAVVDPDFQVRGVVGEDVRDASAGGVAAAENDVEPAAGDDGLGGPRQAVT